MSASSHPFARIAPTTHPCKCCGAGSTLFGVTDFNKSCEDIRQPPAPLSGIPIYYHRCPQCGFIFTTAFDAFTHEDFGREIYNDQYARFDPDYLEARPKTNAEYLARIFGNSMNISILDYGGGSGQLAERLRQQGFTRVETYDPFVPQFSTRPQATFDLLLAFEVIEHTPRPREVFADMLSLLNNPGMALYSTAIQPPEIAQQGVNWWFIAPRNGHCSIHTSQSLDILSRHFNRRTVSTPSKIWHLLLDDLPPFAQHLSIPPK
jgi:2-polyprenyl-6-hydroxyphenyl methylase/3-demethylubiquinone-9 3-methyltransferase